MLEKNHSGDGSGATPATPVKRATVNCASPLAFKPNPLFQARLPQPTSAEREFAASLHRHLAQQRALEDVKRTVEKQVKTLLERELGRFFRR